MNVNELLYKLCEDDNVFNDDFDLINSGLLDSYAIIELFSNLEDMNISLEPSKVKIENLRTPKKIKEIIDKYGK